MIKNYKTENDSRLSELSADVICWNNTERNFPLDRTVISFFEEQVQKSPEKIAVLFEGATLTYAELNRQANHIAWDLIGRGVQPDDFVGVYMQRSLEMVVALVGIVKAGAAYVPFDPSYPKERLDYMVVDSGVRIVLTHRVVEGITFPAGTTCIYLDDTTIPVSCSDDNISPEFRGRSDNLVYMLYTSGSTGKPKGVPSLHQALTNKLFWMQDVYQLTPEDCILQKTPFSFDVSFQEFFWPLMIGASICIAKPDGHKDNKYLVDLIASAGITIIHFVPSMLSLFLTEEGLDRLTSLRLVMCSGEALPYELTRRFFEKLPGKRLDNLYGPTESIEVTIWECKPDSELKIVPIGFPVANVRTYILDEQMKPLPIGEIGELYLGGVQLARGYWNQPELTAQRFVPDPFSSEPGARLYKTGDLSRYLPNGAIEYMGRIDFQVKLRGFRIELGEIEAALLLQPGVREAVVTTTNDCLEEKQLVAYITTVGEERKTAEALRAGLLKKLPEYMVPARFMFLDRMPLSPNGKVDRKALPKVFNQRPELAEMFVAPQTQMQHDLCKVWREILSLDQVGIRDSFFDLGGNSLQLLKLIAELKRQLGKDVPAVKVFQFPSVEKLAAYLNGSIDDTVFGDAVWRAVQGRGHISDKKLSGAIAIIGMVGRFPGATDLNQLWFNLINDNESISRFTPEELAEGVDAETRNDPGYVPYRGIIDDADKFDATFFGIGPMEAKTMDPQQRVFLELAWAALEDAGYDPNRFPGMIGMYAGNGDNHYYSNNVLCHPEVIRMVGKLIVEYGNEKDYLATRASFHLNLTGPSVSANTGCSTALLAIDNAAKSLNVFECDMALAGGIDITIPQKSGQIHQGGGPFTNDGHCRPFDAKASGTMFCDGAGIVVLRRLEDAVAANDHIYAVILGSAKNNDGGRKASFLAPSVEGQSRVIMLAQAQANIQADTIGYVEAHGTGTPLGDPIEFEALTKAFRATTDRKQFCKLGSIKGHIGHPTIAAGVAGLIKTALSLYHEEIPSTLHFEKPNPAIDLENSPFQIVSKCTPWPRGKTSRRAAVSSFGFGGTNVHTILEEAPPVQTGSPGRLNNLILFSAKSSKALDRVHNRFSEYFSNHLDATIADIAYTLQLGRQHFAYRDYVIASDVETALQKLSTLPPVSSPLESVDPSVVFLFPGQGAQYVNMGRDLYNDEPVFRQWMDRCFQLFSPHLDRDLKDVLYPSSENDIASANEMLLDTGYTQPALFSVELSLARYWMSLGIKPAAVIGHSIGEFAGACLSDVFTLEDAVSLVALRARLIRELPRGCMLSVNCSPKYLVNKLPSNVQIATINGPDLCVIAGPQDAVNDVAVMLDEQGVSSKMLHTSHAFHSAMMNPIVNQFETAVAKVSVTAPSIPFLSASSAQWMKQADQLGARYWSQHISQPVLFSDTIAKALTEFDKHTIFLEVGPRDVLSTLTKIQTAGLRKSCVLASLGDSAGNPSLDSDAITATIGRLWKNGVSINWDAYYSQQKRLRVSLPTYPFERTSYWLEPVRQEQFNEQSVHSGKNGKQNADSANVQTVNKKENPVKGLKLGYNKHGRAVWFVPKTDQPNTFIPLSDDGSSSENPFTPPLPKTLPTTAAQQKIWNTVQSDVKTSSAFNEAMSIRLTGSLDMSALNAAIQGLPLIHEILRGHFTADGRNFIIEPYINIPVVHHSILSLTKDDIITSTTKFEKNESICPYDLINGPLIRVTILDAGPDEHIILIGAHGSIIDGWSFDTLLQDFDRLYTSFAAIRSPSKLPAHGFSDFLMYYTTPEAVTQTRNSLMYLKSRLLPLPPPLIIDYDNRSTSIKGSDARVATYSLNNDLYSKVKSFANCHGVSFFSVLLAGFAAHLQRRSNMDDFAIGVTFAGQPAVGMEDTVGLFVNTVPVRIQTNIDREFSELCSYCHKLILETGSNATIGIESIFKEPGFTRENLKQLLNIRFTYTQKFSEEELNFGNVGTSYHIVNRCSTVADLELSLFDCKNYLEFIVHCKADIASQKWLELFVKELGDLFALECKIDSNSTDTHAGSMVPQNDIEQFLVEVWKRVMGISDVSVDADFYELGGHSLIAVQIFNEIYSKYKLRLPLSVLIEHSTIRKLAAYLGSVIVSHKEHFEDINTSIGINSEKKEFVEWNTVVPIQPLGNLPPFFCVSGIKGNPMEFRMLSSYIGDKQPFFGLQFRGVDGVHQPHVSIEEMATEFLKDIRFVQPDPPYFIGGSSFGGIVAYEIVQQLIKNGDPVGGLILLDAINPQVVKWTIKDHIITHLLYFATLGPKYFPTFRKVLQSRKHRKSEFKTQSVTFKDRFELVMSCNKKAGDSYIPLPIKANVLLIRCTQRLPPQEYGIGFPPHKTNGWGKLITPDRLIIRSVQTHHLGLFKEPYVAETAKTFTEGLITLREKI